jgi:hypothetical protein
VARQLPDRLLLPSARMLSVLPATSRLTSLGSMPGMGMSIRQLSSLALTWNDGEELAAVGRVGSSLQN